MPTSWTLERARSLWWKKQALAGGKGALAEVLGRSGWLRTLGGADVYLAARARKPGMKRADLDAVIARGELRVVPAARGCIYAVPARFVGDLLAHNAEDWRKTTEKDLGKVGSSLKAIEPLAKAVLAALTAPMTTDALRKAMPAGSIPSFGEAGKKVGLSSPLPLALRMLEFDGRVERTLEGGRLDSERYLWRTAEWTLPRASERPLETVIGALLDFAGPVALAHVAAWSGRSQRDVRPILEQLAVPVTVAGLGDAWLPEADAAAKPPAPAGLALLAFEDNYLVTHGTLGAVTDPEHHAIRVDIWGGSKPETLGEANHVLSRTLVKDGLIIGFWEVDPGAKGAVWHTFAPAPRALASALDDATAATAAFLLDELGHARSFSLDTMEQVQARADRIRALRDGKKKNVAAAKRARR